MSGAITSETPGAVRKFYVSRIGAICSVWALAAYERIGSVTLHDTRDAAEAELAQRNGYVNHESGL